MTKAAIGFVGTGIMGYQMARRLAEAGHPVTAWNRSREKAERLTQFGVAVVDDPAAVAAGAGAVICMLSDGATCDAVLIDGGVMAAMPKGSVVINMASISVEAAQGEAAKAAEMGLGFLDAPVSGGEKGATEGTLAILVGGEQTVFDQVKAILEVMGRPTLVGPAGSGDLTKLANQLIVANTIATMAEAMLFLERGGADPAAAREAMLGGFADSTILKQHALRMIARDWVPGGPTKHQVKDQRAQKAFAEKLGLTLPMSELGLKLFEEMCEAGGGDDDHSAMFREVARRNGIEVG